MANNGGDQLARGAKSATFGPAAKISQAKWDAIFGTDEPQEPKKKSKEIEKSNGKSS